MFSEEPKGLQRFFPILNWLPRYNRVKLRHDLIAGLVMAALAIPQALGYAAVAGVPVQVGLYTLPAALLAYAIFGSSKLLVVGPVSTVSLLSGSLVSQISGGDVNRAVALTSAIALFAGVFLVLAGLARIGWVAEFLSEPIVNGFVVGLVVLVIVGVVPQLLGSPSVKGGVGQIQQSAAILKTIYLFKWPTVIASILSIIFVFGGQALTRKIPWSLLLVAGAAAASAIFNLHSVFDIAVVGRIPSGVSGLHLPPIAMGDILHLIIGGLAVGLIGLAEGLAAARLFSQNQKTRLDSNQELIAHGMVDIASGLFGGMGAAGSLSKTGAADRAGSRGQMTGIIAAAIAIVTLLAAAPLLSPLPSCVLAVIVINAVWNLVHVQSFMSYRRVRLNDFYAALFAFGGVLLLGPLYGLLLAVGTALLGLIYRSSKVEVDVLGKIPGEKAAWGSVDDHPERLTPPGVLLLRLNAPLFWVNASDAADRVVRLVNTHQDTRVVVLDLAATNQLDVSAARHLETLVKVIRSRGMDIHVVLIFDQARRVLGEIGVFDLLGHDHVWHAASAAVRAARIESAESPESIDQSWYYTSHSTDPDPAEIPAIIE